MSVTITTRKQINISERKEAKKMIKRSRANKTERGTFRNIWNENKFIDVVHHGDGHYYMIQYIKHEFPGRTVVNYIGTRCGHKQKFRIGKTTLLGILEDYEKIEEVRK